MPPRARRRPTGSSRHRQRRPEVLSSRCVLCRAAMSDDRTYVITGANTGIGRATAHELARRGGRVVIASRSAEKTLPVVDHIKSETGNNAVAFVPLDLADLASV